MAKGGVGVWLGRVKLGAWVFVGCGRPKAGRSKVAEALGEVICTASVVWVVNPRVEVEDECKDVSPWG